MGTKPVSRVRREAVVAGTFYPADPEGLRRAVEESFPAAAEPVPAVAVISPHAGYVYSGRVAGTVFASVELPPTFLILCPNHTGRGRPVAINTRGEWRTPLGAVPISEDLADALCADCPLFEEDSDAHAREHALEVQLPFLQVRRPGCAFVPVCVGLSHPTRLAQLGEAIGRVLADFPHPVLIVISSDMDHYEPHDTVLAKDERALEPLCRLDVETLFRRVREERITMCGLAPAVAGLTAARALGATAGAVLAHTTSGPVSGDYDEVVGYAGVRVA